MSTELELLVRAILIGVGATVVMDTWALVMKIFFGVPPLNYAMLGRWLGHMPGGQFAHNNIANASRISGEPIIGWIAHYIIGVIFAGVLMLVWGLTWARDPSVIPALLFGIATVAAPFLIMQPCMGFGLAASKTPSPNLARFRSTIAHTAFGVGLFLSAWFVAQVPSL